MDALTKKPKKIRWAGVIFLSSTALAGFVAAPLYFLYVRPLTPAVAAIAGFYALANLFSITLGYHRFFSHAAFKASPLVQWLTLFFGAAAFEQSALRWASLHRTHHRYVDTDRDPYNIKRGFFYAHMGWLFLSKPAVDYDNAMDLRKNALVMHQHEHYQLWALGAGLALPVALGVLAGDAVGTLLLAVGARLTVVHHCTFFINSFAHTFGTQDYDGESTARDNWFGAVLTNGEGYHNYHHRFPSDYRNGVRWYHWDPTKWAIWTLSKVGLTRDLQKTPPARIAEAKAQVREKRALAVVSSLDKVQPKGGVSV